MVARMIALRRAAVALAYLSLLWMGAWYGFLEPPFLSYRNLPFPSERPVVLAGQPIPLRVVRCNGDTKTRNYLISHRLIRLDAAQPPTILTAGSVSIEPGCTSETSKANVVPADQEQGHYFVEGFAEVNGTIRTHSIHWYSEPFYVRTKP